MTEAKFSIGDPVWSKMKGYCPWPSRIADPSESTLKNTAADKLKTPKVHYLVYFFGSNNYAWMPDDTVKPFEQFKDKNKNGSKSAQFKQGLKQIDEYIANGGKTSLVVTISGAAIKNNSNNDSANSPARDSLSNDASNLDAPASIQRDYSRTPFKSRKLAKGDESSTDITSPSKRVKTSDDDNQGASSPTAPTSTSTSRPPTSKSGARNVLLRATHYTDIPIIETPQVNLNSVSAKAKSIRPSTLKFGFIGLGLMGQRLLKNLLTSGHQVTIWNRTQNKCKEFIEAGASHGTTPADVVSAADIVFSCLSDPKASKEIVFGPFGILDSMDTDKGYVEMSSIDPETSADISEAIITKGGRYLVAPPIGNGKKAAEEGELTIVAAGDKKLYEDCSSCFQAMGRQTFFLGHAPGYANQMNLIMSSLYGSMVATLAECCALVERCNLSMETFRDILKLSQMKCPLLENALDKIIKKDQTVQMPLNHLQKDLRLSLMMAEDINQTCPITAITNEMFKTAKFYGYGEYDVSSVHRHFAPF